MIFQRFIENKQKGKDKTTVAVENTTGTVAKPLSENRLRVI
jgi:hypothetical protein